MWVWDWEWKSGNNFRYWSFYLACLKEDLYVIHYLVNQANCSVCFWRLTSLCLLSHCRSAEITGALYDAWLYRAAGDLNPSLDICIVSTLPEVSSLHSLRLQHSFVNKGSHTLVSLRPSLHISEYNTSAKNVDAAVMLLKSNLGSQVQLLTTIKLFESLACLLLQTIVYRLDRQYTLNIWSSDCLSFSIAEISSLLK